MQPFGRIARLQPWPQLPFVRLERLSTDFFGTLRFFSQGCVEQGWISVSSRAETADAFYDGKDHKGPRNELHDHDRNLLPG